MIKGIGVSPGVGNAPALLYQVREPVVPQEPAGDIPLELERFRKALARVIGRYRQSLEKADGTTADIIASHIMLLEDDDSLGHPIRELIRGGCNAADATARQFDKVIAMMEALEDELLRQRAGDLKDLRYQVLCSLLDIAPSDLANLASPVVLVAKDLSPSDTMRINLSCIAGIVCEQGGKTSHTAVLAKAMGIPAIVSCTGAAAYVQDGQDTLMDGTTGEVICAPTAEQQNEWNRRAKNNAAEEALLEGFRGRPTLTADGRRLSLCANIATPDECKAAMEWDCEGIGLFRSEFLYMNRSAMPSEEEQFEAYKKALVLAAGKPVTIRTLDAGGDKSLPFLTLPKEDNPFLGYRAIRICLDHRDVFKAQLRALLRAGVYGNLRIMFPMISSLEELSTAKALLQEAKSELAEAGAAYRADIPVGMMVEVPSAALLADRFAQEVDFFSIGTNDLVQYTVAVDRGNESVAHLYSHYHPAVLQLVAQTIRAARRRGIPCCMCGEAAGDTVFLPLLVGLGLREFSIAAPGVLAARKLLSEYSAGNCASLADKAMNLSTDTEVQALLAAHRANISK